MTQPFPKIISGDGKSPDTPVRFEPCRAAQRVAAERAFICAQFGESDQRELMHYTSLDSQSVWSIALLDGSFTNVYFDTTGTIYDE